MYENEYVGGSVCLCQSVYLSVYVSVCLFVLPQIAVRACFEL